MYVLEIENKNKILNVVLLFYLKDEMEKGNQEYQKTVMKLSQKIYDLDDTHWSDIFEKGMKQIQNQRNSN